MTYVELIVVLSIFAVMSSIVMFNYSGFQAKIDIKNLASDIALKVVQAQKSSLSGFLPPATEQYSRSNVDTWKPSYGVYFDITSDSNKRSFVYFVDGDNSGTFDGVDVHLNDVLISKGSYYISGIEVFYWEKGSPGVPKLDNLTITFSRPNSGAVIKDNGGLIESAYLNYVGIVIRSPKGVTSMIKVYDSGRIQID